jgi:hypothetical protein
MKKLIEKYVNRLGYVPKVYYVGMGKTASESLCAGFTPHARHYHGTSYFQKMYKTTFLTDNNLNVYDLILSMGKEYKFSPLIVECIREPITHKISSNFQHLKLNRKYQNKPCQCDLCMWKKNDVEDVEALRNVMRNSILKLKTDPNIPYSHRKWKKYFGIDLLEMFNPEKRFLYKEVDNAKLLFIRYEDTDSRQEIFKETGYEYTNVVKNKTNKGKNFISKCYNEIKNNLHKLKLSCDDVDKIYSNKYVTSFYSNEEINNFKSNFLLK